MILIVCNQPDTILFWRRHFFARGLCSVAFSYRNVLAGNFEKHLYDIAFVPALDDTAKPPRFLYSFRIRYPHIPIAVLHPGDETHSRDAKDATIHLDGNHTPHLLIGKMLFEASTFHGRDICDCVRGIVRDHLIKPHPTICDTPLPLTPTERMIFHYLLLSYPRAVTARELYRNCIKPGSSPHINNISSHIYRINFKSRQLVGFPVIIKGSQSAYRLNLP